MGHSRKESIAFRKELVRAIGSSKRGKTIGQVCKAMGYEVAYHSGMKVPVGICKSTTQRVRYGLQSLAAQGMIYKRGVRANLKYTRTAGAKISQVT